MSTTSSADNYGNRSSRSVTVRRGFGFQMLQIETLVWRVLRLSRSVTSRPEFRSHLLQIEMFVSAPAPPLAVVPYKQTPW